MEARQLDADVLIAGGGPAGCAAAIGCAEGGLRTILVDRDAGPRERPGEALHPGVEPLLGALGIDGLERVTGARHEGIWVGWGEEPRFEPFGSDAEGPWRGFQVDRRGLDRLLQARAREAGAEVRSSCKVGEPIVEARRSRVLRRARGPCGRASSSTRPAARPGSAARSGSRARCARRGW